MRSSWIISGAGHLLLILFLLFGGLWSRDRIPDVTVSEVTVISEAEYALLATTPEPPDVASDAPAATPPAEDAAPEAPSEDSVPEVSEPGEVEIPEAPENPDITIPEPVPDALVEDDAPVIETPPTDIDGSSPVAEGTPQPAPRVAPTPEIAPPPVAEVAPERVEDRAPDPDAPPEEAVPDEPPAAPEEASDRIVTEAEETRETAPATAMRPRARPPRPIRQSETPRAPAPETPARDPVADAVADAVAEANAQPAPQTDAPQGPPLTGGEKDALRVAVSQCWNVGSLSTEALGTTVVLSVEMSQDGKPVSSSIRLVSSSGGSSGAAQQAFEAARRAIIRCGARGFPLPVEKYGQWRDIEMTFNPEGMQFR